MVLWVKHRTVVGLAAVVLHILPGIAAGQSVVGFDTDGTVLVNGERTFLYGTYRDPSDNWGTFTGIDEAQFNFVHDYFFETLDVTNAAERDAWISQARAYLDLAEQHGVGVFLGLPRNVVIEDPDPVMLAQLVNGVKDKPALYFWRLYDEPSNQTFQNPVNLAHFQAAYAAIKANDPNHPVDAVDAFRLNEVDTYTDVISVELYPIRTDNIHTITDDDAGLMRSVRELAAARQAAPSSPFVSTLQGLDWRIAVARSQGTLNQLDIDGSNHRPSPAEVRAQAHLMLTQGVPAPTFYWGESGIYDLQDEAPEVWQAFVDLGAEFATIGEALVSTEPTPAFAVTPILDATRAANTPNDVDIFHWARMHEGEMFLGLVNPGDWAFNDVVDVRIDLPLEEYDRVTVLGGGVLLERQQNGDWQLHPDATDLTVLGLIGDALYIRTDYADTLVLHLQTVPEPGSTVLLSLGACAMMLKRRNPKRRTPSL